MFLNTSADKVVPFICSKTFFPPAKVLNALRDLGTLRHNLFVVAERHGYAPLHTTPQNKAYFALELLEQLYIRTFPQELSHTCVLASVVLVHDGVYLSPPPSLSNVATASARAAQATGIPTLNIAYKDLAPIWDRYFGHLNRLIALRQQQPKRPRIAGENFGCPATGPNIVCTLIAPPENWQNESFTSPPQTPPLKRLRLLTQPN